MSLFCYLPLSPLKLYIWTLVKAAFTEAGPCLWSIVNLSFKIYSPYAVPSPQKWLGDPYCRYYAIWFKRSIDALLVTILPRENFNSFILFWFAGWGKSPQSSAVAAIAYVTKSPFEYGPWLFYHYPTVPPLTNVLLNYRVSPEKNCTSQQGHVRSPITIRTVR